MSVSKSYNRIVFLTTLSVYLGLVLVGGTAPVLAHSALTRNFDVRNEIEFKDDLDKKPNDKPCAELESKAEEQESLFFEHYAQTFSSLFEINNAYQETAQFKESKELKNLFPALNSVEHKNDKQGLLFKFNVKSDFEHHSVLSPVLPSNSSLIFLRSKEKNNPKNLTYENTKAIFSNGQVFIVTHFPRASIDEFLARKDAR